MSATIRRFLLREKTGVAAIEFAILGPLFVGSIAAFFQITYFAFASNAFQTAVIETIDDIRTGYAYSEMASKKETAKAWMTRRICADVPFSNCEEKLQIKITTYGADFKKKTESSGDDTITAGTSGTLTRVEAEIDLDNFAFGKVYFGDAALKQKAGLTFMTEPY
jgi:Flp pilus assembly pilin Flp